MKKAIIFAFMFATLYIAPQSVSAFGSLSLSQTSLNLNAGQSQSISVYSSNGQIPNLTSVTNSAVAYAISSANQVTIYALSAGTTNMTFCTYDNSCATVYVTVGGTNGNNGQISFSQNNVSLAANQTMTVSVYGTNGSLYISNNSNSSVANAYLSGNSINLNGLTNGSTTITVCGSNSTCNYLYVTVTGSNNNGQISFSQNALTMNAGDYNSVTVYNTYNNSLYISNNSNSNAVSAALSGNLISLHALSSGFSLITVCGNSSTCANLSITVNGNSNSGQITFSQPNININVNQSQSVSIYSNNTTNYGYSYYISSNSNSSVASATISGSVLNLYGSNYGSTNITVCQTNSQCGTVYVTVGNNGNQGNLYFTTTTLPQPVINQYYTNWLNVSGGNSPYTFTINSGSLPSGLTLNSSGQITGTTNNNYSSTFTVRANDNYGHSGVSQSFTLTPTGSVLGSNVYNNGTLVNDGGTIYITYKNTKSPFASAAAFTGLGFKFSNVITGSVLSLNYSGFTVGSTNIAHPWGSWVKNGTTIYFVYDQGLIPVPSMDVFTSNGGNLNNVVAANGYDMAKPIQYSMSANDFRLK